MDQIHHPQVIDHEGRYYDVCMAADLFGNTGKRIRALRENRDLNQKELASALKPYGIDVGNSFISQMESSGKQPSLEMLVALARVLGTTTDYLLMLTDDPNPPRSTDSQVIIEVSNKVERSLIEDWVDLIQDADSDKRKGILDAVRLLLGPTKPHIIGG